MFSMKKFGFKHILLYVFLLVAGRMFGAGWTPTDAGLVVNFEPGDQFLLSVMIDDDNNPSTPDVEYFVCDYPSYSGGKFKYASGNTLKLIPQTAGATEPSAASVWTIDTAVTRVSNKVNYALGGASYTMWSSYGQTLYTAESSTKSSTFKFLGYLTSNANHSDLCDVVFAVPTDNPVTTNMDPNNTLKRGGKFNGAMGTGFAGMVYREVYMFNIPRSNNPISYTNASLVTFNRGSSNVSWSAGTIKPGQAAYAFADTKHNPTVRTVFRLYVLNDKAFSSCNSYFFGWNVQDYKRYRSTNTLTDSTSARKIYYLDHFECMDLVKEGEPYYQTRGMKIPSSDSTYYYVGYNNDYRSGSAAETPEPLGSRTAASQFTQISNLQVRQLKDKGGDYRPEKSAYGYMAVDTSSTEDNLGVTFEPAGYFFRTSSGVNVPMKQVDDSTWITDQMWRIVDEYMSLKGIVLLYTGSEFSMTDKGAKISNWSDSVNAPEIYITGTTTPAAGYSGWARIHTNRTAKNGGIEFVLADSIRHIHYDYNGLIGTAIPDQYPIGGKSKVQIQDAQLKAGFTFLGWATEPGGEVVYWTKDSIGRPEKEHFVGVDSLELPMPVVVKDTTITLYAVGTFDDTYRVAFSFIGDDDKRYFITHPNSSAPRFARARTFTDWTNVYQGMSDAENSESNYVSTYKMIVHPTCEECGAGDVVLDPKHETVKGVIDSLTFYEHWAPANDEYLGLYYTTPNTLIANNTWAGIFRSTGGWPNYRTPAVDNTKLYSEEYFDGMYDKEGIVKKYRRTNQSDPETALPAYIQYDAGQFNGVEDEEDGTDFQITGIAVADAHYVILPDTTDADAVWRDTITINYHKNAPQEEIVWSKLIGKQLLAVLRVGEDTVYFHPNDKKTITNANDMRLSLDYRLTQSFSLIHDKRAAVTEHIDTLQTSLEETDNGFSCRIVSGKTSPIGPTVDIYDTLRVTLRPAATSKIKNYYGRWKDRAAGLTPAADGSRYRDIIIKTKAYHYGDTQTEQKLIPQKENYSFGAMKDQNQTLSFTLVQERTRQLLDANGVEISKEVVGRETLGTLDLTTATFTLKSDAVFTKGTTTANSITLTTKANNSSSAANVDTLTVTYSGITARVPLSQVSMQGDELIWSVVHDGERYFIMAGSGELIFRDYTLLNSTLYKKNTTTALIKGAENAENNNAQYITPWKFSPVGELANQLILKTEEGVNKYFSISGTEGTVSDEGYKKAVTYDLIKSNVNDNANYEEIVKLRVDVGTWLKFNGTSLETTTNENQADTFSWGYLQQEYNLLNDGTYPSVEKAEFGYNSTSPVTIKTAYKAYREYSMLLDSTVTYLCRETETDSLTLRDGDTWKTSYAVSLIHDSRFKKDAAVVDSAKLSVKADKFSTKITPCGASPIGTKVSEKYANIVDTLQVTLGTTRTDYRFKDWKGVESISDACVKIPLVRKTYHDVTYDSLFCAMDKEDLNYAFPSTITKDVNDTKVFHFETIRRRGTNVLDVDGNLVASTLSNTDTLTAGTNYTLATDAGAEIRLVDDYGNKPDWCELHARDDKTVTVRCKSNGVRSPRSAYLYFAYIVTGVGSEAKYVNFKFTVSQASLFQYTNNQILVHMPGASGDPLSADGRQQVHENKRILYYYNPAPYGTWDQSEELPVRERGFYGFWRWYREGEDQNGVDVSDTDIPDSVWINPPRNIGRYNYPFRIIGDSVDDPKNVGKKKWATMGRYTVFHYPSKGYNSKIDPPSKNPTVLGPWNKDTVTYVVDIGNYYDNLPLSMKNINQVDTTVLDTMQEIIEPTLSIREIFELHPWTEMAEKMERFKDTIEGDHKENTNYLEDHEVMAPIGNRLLLRTEHRYNYKNLEAKGHSESLLGYYMRDDNWATWSSYPVRQDTMIWCGGWDADCEWYTYNPKAVAGSKYTKCNHPITTDDDFLNVPAKTSITSGHDFDTVYYCLRARSKATTGTAPKFTDDKTEEGNYWFNICRYKVIYHDPRQYGPFEERTVDGVEKALITNDEIEQNYEVMERLNFDYVKPGNDYHVYPHPLPWADASYGYSYPVGPEIPDNRYHNDFAPNFPGPGEYSLINRIPYSTYWHKMEQHGGAENGYMIYCDGMSSAGQVAALTLSSHLCEGQRMYFSAYLGNVSNQTGKSNPNFTFTVQGSSDGTTWSDITSYMTGDIQPSDKWNQILFPIKQEESFDQYRVRIYNVSSDFDGNDFILDDMCVFATKAPLIAYQANTGCTEGADDEIKNVVVRVDYQGVDKEYHGENVYYTVELVHKVDSSSFVQMLDGYINNTEKPKADATKPDTIYGHIRMPSPTYTPVDSVFTNLQQLVNMFETSYETWGEDVNKLYREGYVYETLDGVSRPVLYVIHKARMTADNTYNMRMSLDYKELLDSKCAMTSHLNIVNQMMFELDGVEQNKYELDSLCANTTYELGIRVKGTLFLDDAAPIDLTGTCTSDWLLYGDTTDYASTRYGYSYSDIKKVIKDILRNDDEDNENLKATSLAAVKRDLMETYQESHPLSDDKLDAYTILASLVNNGFLTLSKSKITVSAAAGDSVRYMVFPIIGTGYDSEHKQDMQVCPNPLFVKFLTYKGQGAPMQVGGIRRDATQENLPVVVLVNARTANEQITLHIDSLRSDRAIYSVSLISTDDPGFYEGVHLLNLEPDKIYKFGSDLSGYYTKGSDILLSPATSNNYEMKPGYNYTFGITMQTLTGSLTTDKDCPAGTVPFTVSVVPDYLRWAPQSADNNKWNDPNNWIGVDAKNVPLTGSPRFAPIASTDVIIPAMTDGMPYPELPGTIPAADSVKQVGFVYNTCDDIRFLAGAAIGQQQRLDCDMAVVDMRIPNTTWALRAAPVTGMLSGDIFMANADLENESGMWLAGEFDANGRTYTYGNASFYLSLYSRETVRVNSNAANDTRSAAAEWSKVTNGMNLSLPVAQGFAVYTHTAFTDQTDPAIVRLPKNDDRYYYYTKYGEKLYDQYVDNLRATRNTNAGGTAGKLAFNPGAEVDHQDYTLTNGAASTSFVFGNPTMGYIDIWGFIADNTAKGLRGEFSYLNESGSYTTVTSATEGVDVITNQARYLPPMHAIVVSVSGEAKELAVTLNTNRIITNVSQVVRGGGAPMRRANANAKAKAIMTVTAVNPVSDRCVSRLLLGQGYDDAIRSGEDAVLTTLNIDKFHMTNSPTTPFNIYAQEGEYGMSIDLRDSLVNVPISFYMSALPYDPVTQLWFTGVNGIDGTLVLYDALTDTERTIIDGICLQIETPEVSHETRYYIRRKGYKPDEGNTVPTGTNIIDANDKAQKILHNGQVLILRDGHVYTMFGQKIR